MKKRHTEAEISAKLEQAADMAARGELHGDIARALGISLMTYHRWRKAREKVCAQVTPTSSEVALDDLPTERDHIKLIGELQLENARLRRLVTDLLLEKVRLEESLRAPPRRSIGRS